MTIAEFLALLEFHQTIHWGFSKLPDLIAHRMNKTNYLKSVAIRTLIDGREVCPLELMAYWQGFSVNYSGGRLYRPPLLEYYWQFGEALGLSNSDADRLMMAIDNDGFDTWPLRGKLLNACRLKENIC